MYVCMYIYIYQLYIERERSIIYIPKSYVMSKDSYMDRSPDKFRETSMQLKKKWIFVLKFKKIWISVQESTDVLSEDSYTCV